MSHKRKPLNRIKVDSERENTPESDALRGESLAMHEAQPILIPFSSNASGINLHLILKLPFNMIMSRKRTRKVDWKYFFLNVVSVEGESGTRAARNN